MSDEATCEICGFTPRPWDELVNGECEDCRFDNRVDGGQYP